MISLEFAWLHSMLNFCGFFMFSSKLAMKYEFILAHISPNSSMYDNYLGIYKIFFGEDHMKHHLSTRFEPTSVVHRQDKLKKQIQLSKLNRQSRASNG